MKVLDEKVFECKPFKKITIGYPSYLAAIRDGEDRGGEKKLVLMDYKPSASPLQQVRVRRVVDTYENMNFESIEIEIFRGSNKEMLSLYGENRFYLKKTKKDVELGCDTACFCIEVDDKYLEIKTGADGFYGDAHLYKQYFGCHISLSIDSDMMSFEEACRNVEYLFGGKGVE